MRGVVVLCFLCVWQAGAHYAFYRSMGGRAEPRRVFGGAEARLSAWPGACALLDRYLRARCSCAVLAPRWALTAAHCVVPIVRFVQYNGREPADSNIATVYLLYAHPEYHTVAQDRGYGPEVVILRHDVGLVRTREDMILDTDDYSSVGRRAAPPPPPPPPRALSEEYPDEDPNTIHDGDPVSALVRYDVKQLVGHQIHVLGFGVSEQSRPLPAQRLHEVMLRLVACEQEGWLNCACAAGTARGACAGDSGGPVLYGGTQIGVMSLGPLECGMPNVEAGREVRSVFTALAPYAAVINATLHDAPDLFRMRVVRSAAPRLRPARLLAALSLLLSRSL